MGEPRQFCGKVCNAQILTAKGQEFEAKWRVKPQGRANMAA